MNIFYSKYHYRNMSILKFIYKYIFYLILKCVFLLFTSIYSVKNYKYKLPVNYWLFIYLVIHVYYTVYLFVYIFVYEPVIINRFIKCINILFCCLCAFTSIIGIVFLIFENNVKDKWPLIVMGYYSVCDLLSMIIFIVIYILVDNNILSKIYIKIHTNQFKYEKIKENGDKECAICKEEYKINDDITKLSCEHYYHKHCIFDWFRKKDTCPTCRKPFNAETYNLV